jgi:hypothetical protein
VTIPSPGAAIHATSGPKFEKLAIVSTSVVDATPMTFDSPAGYTTRRCPSLPAAATVTIFLPWRYRIARSSSCDEASKSKLMLRTFARLSAA